MKRAAVIILLLCLIPAAAFALDPRLSAMGDTGIAVSGPDMNSYPNPAAVYFDENTFTFAVYTALSDTAAKHSIPYLPGSSSGVLFVDDMITIGIEMNLQSRNFREDTGNVDLFRTTQIRVNLGAGIGHISAGVGITGGSTRQRLDVVMDDVADLFVQSLLAPYTRVLNSEFIQVDVGLLLNYNRLNVGILMENIISRDGTDTSFNLGTLFAETGIGAYWSLPEYGARGRMNNLVYSLALEFDNVFDRHAQVIKAGGEVRLRLVRDSSVSLRGGCQFYLSGERRFTAGVSVNLKKIEMFINGDFPLAQDAVIQIGAVARL